MKQKLSVAIDGPAAAGKSTVAKIIAEDYSYIYIDTGAMYRALTYKAIEAEVDLKDENKVANILSKIKIDLIPSENGQIVLVNEENVTEMIRTNQVTNNVSFVAMHSKVREEMLRRQRDLANDGGVVMDGRDIGTHVLPNAELKIFLKASVEERAKRRYDENIKKGFTEDLEKLKTEIANRDKLDSEREIAPLKKADDAIEIDTTSLSIQDVVKKIEEYIEERL
ncbi:(d)CMP kinase [Metabacillus litoralis]|uniref:(d)CMP kinase n=1 Tax=Metabacillus litoralis TaxID=152268 RepID=UPI001CFD08B5|nr:(d)CMP kinase [Metabacillus litoralis]